MWLVSMGEDLDSINKNKLITFGNYLAITGLIYYHLKICNKQRKLLSISHLEVVAEFYVHIGNFKSILWYSIYRM